MKQQSFDAPGMKPKVHKDISEAAEKLLDAKLDQKAIKGRVDERTDALIAAMRKHKITAYSDRARGIHVTIEDDTKVKVKKARPGATDDEAAE